jgi:hypothetical protein
MTAATAVPISKGDVLMSCPSPGCPGRLVYEQVAGPMLGAACSEPGCQEWCGIRRQDAERLAVRDDDDREDVAWWDR